MKRDKEPEKHNEESKSSKIVPEKLSEESELSNNESEKAKTGKKKQKKHNPLRTTIIVILCIAILGGALYQGYRMVRDFVLQKVIVFFLENERQQAVTSDSDVPAEEKMDLHDVAAAFERLNGVEPEGTEDAAANGNATSDKITEKPVDNEQLAKDIVSQIPEADKNRAIAIVSSVASVDDCFALYELAINGDQNAKDQLKAIYARFTQAQTDELWALYEKHKHLLE